ncbi:MAG: T9SS type A sorting domain-containing protein [Flavobacteriaceae bacterium]|nr:T9SS type A sorting domain-containing protein [Flavobacteriaceae bacterium]
MKKTLLLFLLLPSIFYAQIVDIPDPNFKNKLVNQTNPVIDTNGDGEIQLSEAKATTQISISSTKISDITGIESFINLENLIIQISQFTTADLSQNIKLEQVFLIIGSLESITLPDTPDLLRVELWSNSLTNVDVSNNPNLDTIHLFDNNINSLDVSNNLALNEILIYDNPIDNVDVSMLINLELLSISNTNIASIDLTNNINLTSLSLGNTEGVSPITSLDLSSNINLEGLNVKRSGLSGLDISSNTNLKRLSLQEVAFSSIDISNNLLLEQLTFRRVDLNTLDVSQNIELVVLTLEGTLLSTVDLSQNILLEQVTIANNGFTSLNLSQNSLLDSLIIQGTEIVNLDLSQNTLLDEISLAYNPLLTAMDLSGIAALSSLAIAGGSILSVNYPDNNYLLRVTFYGTEFEELNFSALDNLCRVTLHYNLNLTSLNIKNGNTAALVAGNSCVDGTSGLSVRYNPNLHVICVDDAVFAANNLPFVSPYITYVDDCSITSTDLNILEGIVSYDLDNNGCSTGDLPLEEIVISSTDGTNNFAVTSKSIGDYQLNLSENIYTTNVVGLSSYFTVFPMDAVDIFVGFNQVEQQNFCVQSEGSFNDLNVSINPNFDPVPGGLVRYSLVAQNAGTTQLNGVVTLDFDSKRVSFFGADPVPTSQTTSSVTWNLGVLQVFSNETIEVSFDVADEPINMLGDMLNYSVTIEPVSGDETPDDNQFDFSHVVEAMPFVDNMTVVQGGQVLVDDAENYLNYVVSFENTSGTTVSDVFIHSLLNANLDFNTIQILDSSHPVRFNMFDNEAHFWMDDINLPDNGSGYLVYRIRPKQGIGLGDIVSSSVSIHMSGLPPIFSNTVTTTFVDELAISDVQNVQMSLYPNPTDGQFSIQSSVSINEVSVISLLGQKVLTQKMDSDEVIVDISSQPAGTYFVRVMTSNSNKIFQIIKK